MAGILELVFAAVQNHKVEAVNHIMIGSQQRHLAQVGIISLLVE